MCSDFHENVKKLEQIFSITISNEKLFKKALTHSSFTGENDINKHENYERLEFLGDAVLKLCISDVLYKKFPKYQEGELTKIRSIIISDNILAEVATNLGIADLLILSNQEEKTGGRKRKSILACAFEAILGAYYLSGQYNDLYIFLDKIFTPLFEDIDKHFEKFNAKAILQEYTQSLNKEIPQYKIVKEIGPQHNKIFVVEVYYAGKVLASGEGKTKKDAEQASAYEACLKLKVIK